MWADKRVRDKNNVISADSVKNQRNANELMQTEADMEWAVGMESEWEISVSKGHVVRVQLSLV